MPHDPNVRHRRSIRLPDYDYSSAGAHFLTVCTRQREALLGEIVADVMEVNEYGRVIADVWAGLSERYPGVETDAFEVMPNHMHGIIIVHPPSENKHIVGAIGRMQFGLESPGAENGAIRELPLQDIRDPHVRRKMLLPKIVGYLKMNAAKRINALCGMAGTPFWQRGYYEHIIRNDRELCAIRRYIAENPLKWALDSENPANARPPQTTIVAASH